MASKTASTKISLIEGKAPPWVANLERERDKTFRLVQVSRFYAQFYNSSTVIFFAGESKHAILYTLVPREEKKIIIASYDVERSRLRLRWHRAFLRKSPSEIARLPSNATSFQKLCSDLGVFLSPRDGTIVAKDTENRLPLSAYHYQVQTGYCTETYMDENGKETVVDTDDTYNIHSLHPSLCPVSKYELGFLIRKKRKMHD
jgi:hypothetical protein